MGYLIDTNVLLELQKGDRANAGVWEWYEAVDQTELFSSVLVIGELRQGIERLWRHDAIQAARLEECLLAVQLLVDGQILPITQTIPDR